MAFTTTKRPRESSAEPGTEIEAREQLTSHGSNEKSKALPLDDRYHRLDVVVDIQDIQKPTFKVRETRANDEAVDNFARIFYDGHYALGDNAISVAFAGMPPHMNNHLVRHVQKAEKFKHEGKTLRGPNLSQFMSAETKFAESVSKFELLFIDGMHRASALSRVRVREKEPWPRVRLHVRKDFQPMSELEIIMLGAEYNQESSATVSMTVVDRINSLVSILCSMELVVKKGEPVPGFQGWDSPKKRRRRPSAKTQRLLTLEHCLGRGELVDDGMLSVYCVLNGWGSGMGKRQLDRYCMVACRIYFYKEQIKDLLRLVEEMKLPLQIITQPAVWNTSDYTEQCFVLKSTRILLDAIKRLKSSPKKQRTSRATRSTRSNASRCFLQFSNQDEITSALTLVKSAWRQILAFITSRGISECDAAKFRVVDSDNSRKSITVEKYLLQQLRNTDLYTLAIYADDESECSRWIDLLCAYIDQNSNLPVDPAKQRAIEEAAKRAKRKAEEKKQAEKRAAQEREAREAAARAEAEKKAAADKAESERLAALEMEKAESAKRAEAEKQAEAERKAAAQKAESERLAALEMEKAEAARRAEAEKQAETERKAAADKAESERFAALEMEKAEAARRAEAEKQAEAEKKAAEAKAESERLAALEVEKAEAARRAEAEKKAEAERKAAEAKAESERLAALEMEKAEVEKKAAADKAESERLAALEMEKAEAARRAEAEKKAEAERKAAEGKAESERLAALEMEKAEAARRAEAEKQAEAEKRAAEAKAESERLAALEVEKAEAARRAEAEKKAEAERTAAAGKARSERLAALEKEKAEVEKKAAADKAESERLAALEMEKAEAARRAEAEKQAEAERKAAEGKAESERLSALEVVKVEASRRAEAEKQAQGEKKAAAQKAESERLAALEKEKTEAAKLAEAEKQAEAERKASADKAESERHAALEMDKIEAATRAEAEKQTAGEKGESERVATREKENMEAVELDEAEKTAEADGIAVLQRTETERRVREKVDDEAAPGETDSRNQAEPERKLAAGNDKDSRVAFPDGETEAAAGKVEDGRSSLKEEAKKNATESTCAGNRSTVQHAALREAEKAEGLRVNAEQETPSLGAEKQASEGRTISTIRSTENPMRVSTENPGGQTLPATRKEAVKGTEGEQLASTMPSASNEAVLSEIGKFGGAEHTGLNIAENVGDDKLAQGETATKRAGDGLQAETTALGEPVPTQLADLRTAERAGIRAANENSKYKAANEAEPERIATEGKVAQAHSEKSQAELPVHEQSTASAAADDSNTKIQTAEEMDFQNVNRDSGVERPTPEEIAAGKTGENVNQTEADLGAPKVVSLQDLNAKGLSTSIVRGQASVEVAELPKKLRRNDTLDDKRPVDSEWGNNTECTEKSSTLHLKGIRRNAATHSKAIVKMPSDSRPSNELVDENEFSILRRSGVVGQKGKYIYVQYSLPKVRRGGFNNVSMISLETIQGEAVTSWNGDMYEIGTNAQRNLNFLRDADDGAGLALKEFKLLGDLHRDSPEWLYSRQMEPSIENLDNYSQHNYQLLLRAMGIRPPHRSILTLPSVAVHCIRRALVGALSHVYRKELGEHTLVGETDYLQHNLVMEFRTLRSKLDHSGFVIFPGIYSKVNADEKRANPVWLNEKSGESSWLQHSQFVNDVHFLFNHMESLVPTCEQVDSSTMTDEQKRTWICSRNFHRKAEHTIKNHSRLKSSLEAVTRDFEWPYNEEKSARLVCAKASLETSIMQIAAWLRLEFSAYDKHASLESRKDEMNQLNCPDTGGRFITLIGANAKRQVGHLDEFIPNTAIVNTCNGSLELPSYFALVSGALGSSLWVAPYSHCFINLTTSEQISIAKATPLYIQRIPPWSLLIKRGDLVSAGSGGQDNGGLRCLQFSVPLPRAESCLGDGINSYIARYYKVDPNAKNLTLSDNICYI